MLDAEMLSCPFLRPKFSYGIQYRLVEEPIITPSCRYLIGKSRFHSPLLLMCGVRLANLDKEDYEIIDMRAEKMLSFRSIRNLQELAQWMIERVGSSLMNSLEVAAFFLQFLDWFYSSSNTPRSLTNQPIPPPPKTAGIQKK
nr:peroxisome assembly protein 12-like [Cherax quadricarinatus]